MIEIRITVTSNGRQGKQLLYCGQSIVIPFLMNNVVQVEVEFSQLESNP